jgi:hypothetical protein
MTTGLDGLQIPFINPYDDEPEYLYSTMVFQQSVAPVGWTKRTNNNDCMLRIVSDLTSPDSGGSNPLTSTVFANQPLSSSASLTDLSTDVHFTTVAEMPAHTHYTTVSSGLITAAFGAPSIYVQPTNPGYMLYGSMATAPISISSSGPGMSSAGHSHTIPNVNVPLSNPTNSTVSFKFKYVDAIIATRYYRGLDE